MSEFKDDDDFFSEDGAEGTSESNGLQGIDLSESDLTVSTGYKDVPVGTWLHLKVYATQPGTVQSGGNYGKPKYHVTLMTHGESEEYGTGRKFPIFANMFGKAFPIVAYPFLRAVDMAPTKEQIKIGAFFSDAHADEYPADFPLSPAKSIPAGAYIFPPPSALEEKLIWGKVTEYSGDNSGFKKFASRGSALAAKDDEGNLINTRAYPQVGEFLSESEYDKLMAKQSASMSTFKGDA
jgi:hypothetical protein